MGHGWTYDDIFAVGLGSVAILLGVHSCLTLIIKSASLKGWRHVEGLLGYFNSYEEELVNRHAHHIYNGTGIEAEYSYHYGAAEFKGKYVSVADMPPRLWAAEYRDLVPGLKDAYLNKKPIQVLVNPEKPHQAVLAYIPVSTQVMKALAALLLGAALLWFEYMQFPTRTDWLAGAAVGFLVYLPFAAGLLSTCF